MRGVEALTCLWSMAWWLCALPVGVAVADVHADPPAHVTTVARVARTTAQHTSNECTIQLGKSVEGRTMEMTVFGTDGPAIFIMAGIHGDEGNSTDVAKALLAELQANPALYEHCRIGILPAANPDGLAKHTRANARNVDLNRNFPAQDWEAGGYEWLHHGTCAASEPETRAIVRAVKLLKPVRTMSIHAISGGRECNNFDGPAQTIAAMLSAHNGYPVVGNIGYPTPGSFESWIGADQGIPSITLELPKSTSGRLCWARNHEAIQAFIAPESDSISVVSRPAEDKGESAK